MMLIIALLVAILVIVLLKFLLDWMGVPSTIGWVILLLIAILLLWQVWKRYGVYV